MNFHQTLYLKHNLLKPKTNRRTYGILQRVSHLSDIIGAELGVYRVAYLTSYLNNIPA